MNIHQKYLNNPTFTHYPYTNKKTHNTYFFGETPTYTLISPLFQSIIQNYPHPNNKIHQSILDHSCLEWEAEREWKWAATEMEEEGEDWRIGDSSNLFYFHLQNQSKRIIIVDKTTGELHFEIPLTPENLGKKFEDIITTEDLAKKLEDSLAPRNSSNPFEEVEICAI